MSRSRLSNWAAAVPFTAVCPHCRDAKFQVPWKKVDRPHTCPKCGQEFHLLPDDTPPALMVPAGQSVSAATRLTAPVVPPPPSPAATEPAAEVPSPPTHDLRGRADAPTVMALLGVALFGLAVVASQFPYGRLVAAGLAGVGAILAGLSLLGLDGWRRVGWAGVGLNTLTLLLVLALPGWLGLTGWVPVPEPGDGPKPVTAVGRDDGLPRPADWVDAGAAVWEQGDVRVAVIGASVVPPDPTPAAKGAAPARKELVLKVGLKLTNVGVAGDRVRRVAAGRAGRPPTDHRAARRSPSARRLRRRRRPFTPASRPSAGWCSPRRPRRTSYGWNCRRPRSAAPTRCGSGCPG
ncbi:MAG: hypothetical protein U0871_05345 [Gemmataceae bacterium]